MATTLESTSAKTLPIMEVFGPTIQGEGPDAGTPCYFVRLGYCDFRCSWCDSMHAVDPAQVRANAEQLSEMGVLSKLHALGGAARWVVLSGGNPAVHDLGALVALLHDPGNLQVAVETQGSLWRDWLGHVDRLVISPKPPSSGMTAKHAAGGASAHMSLDGFMGKVLSTPALLRRSALKVVVFDDADLEWAATIHAAYPSLPFYVSCGTDLLPGATELRAAGLPLMTAKQQWAHTVGNITTRWAWLAEAVARDPRFADARVLPQLHALAWGQEKGR